MRALIGSFVVLLALALPVAAETMEDVEYVRLRVPRPASTDRIEVVEFFYYGCGSCNRFEPHLQAWLATAPADVLFKRVPALRKSEWVPLTRLYFALEALGEIERLHDEVYRALHDHDIDLRDRGELRAWARAQGLDANALVRALDSDGVSIKVEQARDETAKYAIQGTPSLVIDGRYMTSGAMVGSVQALIPVIDDLTRKVRSERARP